MSKFKKIAILGSLALSSAVTRSQYERALDNAFGELRNEISEAHPILEHGEIMAITAEVVHRTAEHIDMVRESVLDAMAALAHANAVDHGFYEEDAKIATQLERLVGDAARDRHLLNCALNRLALITSEVGEAVDALRKPGPSEHVPDFSCEEEEVADILIRLLDYAGYRGLRLGPAVVAKMSYNATRPAKHGKTC